MIDFGKFRKSVALLLVFWCAGTGCMLVGYANAVGTPIAESASEASVVMTPAPSCHAQPQRNRKTVSKTAGSHRVAQLGLPKPSRSAALSCCPLTSGSIAPAYRAPSPNAPALINSESQILNLAPLTTARVAVPRRLPNQAHSYLLDCTFRI